MSQPPRISVGMPVYNGERFLRQALDSIVSQTLTEFELIISDNASTDSTGDICTEYANRDPRIRYVRQPANRGAVWNVNHVLALARAPLFTWAHADDVRAPRHLECCVTTLENAPETVVLVCTRSLTIDEAGRSRENHHSMDLRQPRPSDRLRAVLRTDGNVDVVFGAVRTDVLRACGALGPYQFSDVAQVSELALRGEFWEIPEPLFYRRIHPNSSARPDWTPRDTAVYLDPQNKRQIVLPRIQAYRTIRRVLDERRLPPDEATRCRKVLWRNWILPHWRALAFEVAGASRTTAIVAAIAWFASIAVLAAAPMWVIVRSVRPGPLLYLLSGVGMLVGLAVAGYCGRNAVLKRRYARWGTHRVGLRTWSGLSAGVVLAVSSAIASLRALFLESV